VDVWVGVVKATCSVMSTAVAVAGAVDRKKGRKNGGQEKIIYHRAAHLRHLTS
jgi:hypothetical protein